MLALQDRLIREVLELRKLLDQVKTLDGILYVPMEDSSPYSGKWSGSGVIASGLAKTFPFPCPWEREQQSPFLY
jgi:hypothetical protein